MLYVNEERLTLDYKFFSCINKNKAKQLAVLLWTKSNDLTIESSNKMDNSQPHIH